MAFAPPDELRFSPRPNRAREIGWRPWSEETFREARAADKPILLSISAVWCHWCHVMDETTYSAQPVIDIIKREYVPVRVDNDARPDINQRYNMGGWPTTAFLTPGGDILTGATYLPPEQMYSALERVAGFYREHKPEIAARVLAGRQQADGASNAQRGALDPAMVERLLGAVEGAYDPVHGGFGYAPKFPQTEALALLAEQSLLRNEPRLMEMARHSLQQMAGGGTYDRVEGGFFRYSTTADWSVPHFEKMLEDHAGLITALALAGLPDILDDAVNYLDTVLLDPSSGLYGGSQDADEHYYSLDRDGRGELDPPYVDRRVYSSWNSAIAVAFLEADARLGRPRLRERAARLLDALWESRWQEASGLLHVEGVGGQLADQSWGLLAAVRAAGAGIGRVWLERASASAAVLERSYRDAEHGGYFDTVSAGGPGRLRARIKPLAENSMTAIALLELQTLAGEPRLRHRGEAERALESVASLPGQYGLLGAVYARALDRHLKPAVKVTSGSQTLIAAALAANPYTVIERVAGHDDAVVCVDSACHAPTSDAFQLRELVAPSRTTVG